jgi:hypothetical protein
MKKIAEVFAEYAQLLTKQAFIPNPNLAGGQEAGAGQPQAPAQGQGQSAGAGPGPGEQQLLQALQGLPPELVKQMQPQLTQLTQMPPDQRDQAMGQVAQQLAQSGQNSAQPSEATQQAAAPPGSGGEVISAGTPTDLAKSTVTLRIIDLLDLHSGGKATQSQLKVQEHVQKQKIRQDQLTQKAEEQKQQAEVKKQQQAQQQQAQQSGMMGQGIY